MLLLVRPNNNTFGINRVQSTKMMMGIGFVYTDKKKNHPRFAE